MKHISTNTAPTPLGPYSQATVHNGIVQIAMQVAVTPEGEHYTDHSLPEQLRQVLQNIKAILEAAGSDLENCMQVTLYTTDLSQGPDVNKVYKECFDFDLKPARTVIEVKGLPLGFKIAADAVGAVKANSV